MGFGKLAGLVWALFINFECWGFQCYFQEGDNYD